MSEALSLGIFCRVDSRGKKLTKSNVASLCTIVQGGGGSKQLLPLAVALRHPVDSLDECIGQMKPTEKSAKTSKTLLECVGKCEHLAFFFTYTTKHISLPAEVFPKKKRPRVQSTKS